MSSIRKRVTDVSRICRALALLVCLSLAVLAQFELASVVGTLKDPTGLAIAQVTVEIRSLATNITRTTTTSPTGDYDFVALQPGQYTITARQQGFKAVTRTFEIAVGQRLQLDL